MIPGRGGGGALKGFTGQQQVLHLPIVVAHVVHAGVGVEGSHARIVPSVVQPPKHFHAASDQSGRSHRGCIHTAADETGERSVTSVVVGRGFTHMPGKKLL
jgi:hypothetical protein